MLSAIERGSLETLAKKGVRFITLGASGPNFPVTTHTVQLVPDPAAAFLEQLQIDFAKGSGKPPNALLEALDSSNPIKIEAPPSVAVNFSMVEGHPQIFLANFTGLRPSRNAVATTVSSIRIRVPAELGSSASYLPFLGDSQIVRSTKEGGQSVFVLPPLERGAVVTFGTERQ